MFICLSVASAAKFPGQLGAGCDENAQSMSPALLAVGATRRLPSEVESNSFGLCCVPIRRQRISGTGRGYELLTK